jgi:multicomponent Na+:H+ antiporter subunit C
MDIVLAVVIGIMFACGIYMILRRSMVKLILGLSLLGTTANLIIFVLGGLTRAAPPIIDQGAGVLEAPFADPVPQALILTAIVIGFGFQAFALVLVLVAYQNLKTDDIDMMTDADQL